MITPTLEAILREAQGRDVVIEPDGTFYYVAPSASRAEGDHRPGKFHSDQLCPVEGCECRACESHRRAFGPMPETHWIPSQGES